MISWKLYMKGHESCAKWVRRNTHPSSLSMLSPKPGVSTTVRAIRIPSSSSSNDHSIGIPLLKTVKFRRILTDRSWLDLDTLFHVSVFGRFDLFVGKDVCLAQSVHKSCSSCSRCAFKHVLGSSCLLSR
jgi:hypothetical protein